MRQLLFALTFIILLVGCSPRSYKIIQLLENPSKQEMLATKEVKRYVYLRTGIVLPIENRDDLFHNSNNVILVSKMNNNLIKNIENDELQESISKLEKDEYILKNLDYNGSNILILSGNEPSNGTIH